jgi:23S rRNA pseudouridine2605 synthase
VTRPCRNRDDRHNSRVRLNAYLARAGVASRRKADDLIKAGRVTVNGAPGELNTFVESRDRVEVDGRQVAKQGLTYVLLHKPAGVVTTARDPQRRPTVVELVRDATARVVPVGRLDADTTGALLLTNDGELAHRLAHPRYEVEKVYEAEVEGELSDEALRQLEQGVELGDGPTAPAHARRLAPAIVELAIHEGRKHQVKRMLAAVGHPVRRLHRSRYAGLTLEGLEAGAWRELERSEVDQLRGKTLREPQTRR